jgi:acetylglutamate/LysW-gamma-L-alpha-aminoadipate kinase
MAGLTVVKCGGAVDPGPACADISRLRARGQQVVVVHGGAPEIERLAAQIGVQQRTLLSPGGVTSRHTSPAMLDVVTLALAGRAKPRLLRALAAHGVRAAGLTGLDDGLLQAQRKQAKRAVVDGRTMIIRDDLSGRIVAVRAQLPRVLLAAGLTPVISPPATGEDGGPLNVDADRAAAAIAAELGADRLVLLTAAPGLLRDLADPGSLLPRCELPADGPVPHAASGGMHRKLVAAREAVRRGVPEVIIADGRRPRPLTEVAGTIVEVAT